MAESDAVGSWPGQLILRVRRILVMLRRRHPKRLLRSKDCTQEGVHPIEEPMTDGLEMVIHEAKPEKQRKSAKAIQRRLSLAEAAPAQEKLAEAEKAEEKVTEAPASRRMFHRNIEEEVSRG